MKSQKLTFASPCKANTTFHDHFLKSERSFLGFRWQDRKKSGQEQKRSRVPNVLHPAVPHTRTLRIHHRDQYLNTLRPIHSHGTHRQATSRDSNQLQAAPHRQLLRWEKQPSPEVLGGAVAPRGREQRDHWG
jgi:hypothetical protein